MYDKISESTIKPNLVIIFQYILCVPKTGQAGLEAVFQVPMPGNSGSSPDASSISKLL
jgi:hypothetical protein